LREGIASKKPPPARKKQQAGRQCAELAAAGSKGKDGCVLGTDVY